ALTDLSASRLASSGPRPNALPLHNVRDPKTKGRRWAEILIAGRSPFFTPSASALDETDKSHRKDRSAPNLFNVRRNLDVKSLVEPDGIEPTTSCLQSTRSPN